MKILARDKKGRGVSSPFQGGVVFLLRGGADFGKDPLLSTCGWGVSLELSWWASSRGSPCVVGLEPLLNGFGTHQDWRVILGVSRAFAYKNYSVPGWNITLWLAVRNYFQPIGTGPEISLIVFHYFKINFTDILETDGKSISCKMALGLLNKGFTHNTFAILGSCLWMHKWPWRWLKWLLPATLMAWSQFCWRWVPLGVPWTVQFHR